MKEEQTWTTEILRGLLEPTPFGVSKCLAAWDGLTIESQVCLLIEAERQGVSRSLAEKALSSTNAYVRYLAARLLSYLATKDDNLKGQIEGDPNPLVRFSLLESPFVFRDETMDEPAKFFSLPHEARLAKVRRLNSLSGELIATLLTYGIQQLKEGKLSEAELYELTLEYVSGPAFARPSRGADLLEYRDGWTAFFDGRSAKALWHTIPHLPESVAYVLLCRLPEEQGLLGGIPKDVFKQLTPRQLMVLFDRPEVYASRKRKWIFMRALGEKSDVRASAASHNLNLTHAEFSKVLRNEPAKRLQDLTYLASAKGLSLCMLEVIEDSLFEMRVEDQSEINVVVQKVRRTFQLRLQSIMKRDHLSAEITDLRLYRLAKREVKRAEGAELPDLSKCTALFQKHVVKGDVWATFVAYYKEWGGRSSLYSLEEHVPTIEEIEAAEDPGRKQLRLISSRLTDLEKSVIALRAEMESQRRANDGHLRTAIDKVSAQAASIGDRLQEKARFLAELVQIIELRSREIPRYSAVLFTVVIVLLIWLLLKTR